MNNSLVPTPPEPILCVPNPQAREYWDSVVLPYARYPNSDDFSVLMTLDENGENINCELGKRPEVEKFNIGEKILEGIVGQKPTEIADENTIKDRLESSGIVSKIDLQNINQHTRRDDEISRELRKLNKQLIEKRKFINRCKKKMMDYYNSVCEKGEEFEKLLDEESKLLNLYSK